MIRYIRREIFWVYSRLFVIWSQERSIVIILIFSGHSKAARQNNEGSNNPIHVTEHKVSVVAFDWSATIKVMAKCSDPDHNVQNYQKENCTKKF